MLTDISLTNVCRSDDKSLNLTNATPPSIKAVINESDKSLISLTVSLLNVVILLESWVDVYPDKSKILSDTLVMVS